MRLIDGNALYEKTAEWEAQALHMVEMTMRDEDNAEWKRWSTILTERSAFKYDVADAPAIDAVPVVHAYYIPCKSGYGYKCSNCKAREKAGALISGTHKFCYACGARMDGRREDGADHATD